MPYHNVNLECDARSSILQTLRNIEQCARRQKKIPERER